MEQRIDELLSYIKDFTATSAEDVESFRLKLLSRKGEIPALFEDFKKMPPEEKKQWGKKLNELKKTANEKLKELQSQATASKSTKDHDDLSLPADFDPVGSRHPVSSVRDEIIEIFKRLGFNISKGPQIEDDWHNFTALNFPEEHPARDMQDTFFTARNPDWALRTHTSSVQVRAMETQPLPIRTVAPGRVFRNEAISARSHCVFHQIEGLYVDEGVSFADLKKTLLYFAREFFGADTQIRLRPSYFPFTEPSAEMDVYWGLEDEKDYRMTKGTGWLEVLGCGMVDPQVLENCGIDSEKYSGYAFGLGIERIAMQRFQIGDIRMLYENDQRFLSQFKSAL